LSLQAESAPPNNAFYTVLFFVKKKGEFFPLLFQAAKGCQELLDD